MSLPFRDRRAAGAELASRLAAYGHRPDVLVLALPRGGVPVGYEVARALDVPLDVFLVRKLGTPGHEELAMGAIASGGQVVLNPEVMQGWGLSREDIETAAAREHLEIERRERLYRGRRPALQLEGRTLVVVDDGMATGASMRVALRALRERGPRRLVVALPVAPSDAQDTLRGDADELVIVAQPEPFYAVGQWFEDFRQTSDDEVRHLLEAAETFGRPAPGQHP